MTAPTVEAAIHELMDLVWNVVHDLLEQRGLPGDGLEVGKYTGIHSWVQDLTRYTGVHSLEVAVLFVGTRPVMSAAATVAGEKSELAELWDDADNPERRESVEDLAERLRAA